MEGASSFSIEEYIGNYSGDIFRDERKFGMKFRTGERRAH